jgi:hypothetical protein
MPVPSRHAPPLSEELSELIASGVDVYVATRDAALEPLSMLAMGVKVHADGNAVTVYLPEALSAGTLANLRDNGQCAITISRPQDHNTVQVKGTATHIRPGKPAEKDLLAVLRAGLIEQFAIVGIPRAHSRRLVWWPCFAVDVAVSGVYGQTPGPHAGEPMPRA